MTVCSWCAKPCPHGQACECPKSVLYLRGAGARVSFDDDAIDDAVDVVYQSIDRMLCDGKMKEVDARLETIDPSALNVMLCLAWLSITFPARQLLPARAPFAARVRKHLEKVEPLRVEELLHGLEAT